MQVPLIMFKFLQGVVTVSFGDNSREFQKLSETKMFSGLIQPVNSISYLVDLLVSKYRKWVSDNTCPSGQREAKKSIRER